VPVCASCGHDNPADAGFCNACGASLVQRAPTSEQRKVVTVLFCDVTGSTALGERLDPESLRRVLARYFEVARVAVNRHGGVVEKFIGDAVMAIFGVPRVHEDDALRAVRAALELRRSLTPLNEELERDYGTKLAVRIGVNTGEVVTGTEERLATGDAVNVAARLEQAAQPDDILIGHETLRLLRAAVSVETLPPLDLKGKSEPLTAYRLLSLDSARTEHVRPLVEMVGRNRQLRLLRHAFDNVASERACHLFTVLGTAGVGKSRLVGEFLQTLELDEATVLAGHCLSYGEGITYWPVVEIVKQAGGTEGLVDESARGALDALLGDTQAVATPTQTAWAFRKLLEAKAAERPVVCLVDDIQWGEDTFLELVEYVADLSRDAPILLVCMARPELLDRRPTWAGGKLNATSVLLEPLSELETDELISRLLAGSTLDGDLQTRIRRAAGGNPLYVEEMLALVGESGNGADVTVPPTIQALLAARLDQLDAPERQILERGSVEGETFHRGGVAALGAADTQLDSRLTALVRKDLVRPERAQLTGEDGYRFRHLLIRDAAYAALPKATRAELHERFASWLEERGAELVELDEIVGYHLEQAYRYRDELGPLTDADRRTANRAGELLAGAGRRAFDRGDRQAAAHLLGRAVDLLAQPDPTHVYALLDLGRCLGETYDDLEQSRRALDRALAEADVLGREDLRMRAKLELAHVALVTEPEIPVEANQAMAREAVAVLDRFGDEEGLARAWFLVATAIWATSQWDDMLEPLQRSIEHARRAGTRSMEFDAQRFFLAALLFGSTSVDEGVKHCRAILEDVSDNRELQGWALRVIGTLLALEGRVDEGRELLEQARAIFQESGNRMSLAILTFSTAPLELRVGDPVAAERELRASIDIVTELNERGHIANLAALLADALLEQGRIDEAEQAVNLARQSAQAGDVSGQAFSGIAAARLLARRGDPAEAVRLAAESIALTAGTTEYLTMPWLLLRQAEVLQLAGRDEDAASVLDEAVAIAERKGALAEVRRAREQLETLAAGRLPRR
jgi:class 3 adenylate cyclase/tetratricopeptide (TPR) repeat protein